MITNQQTFNLFLMEKTKRSKLCLPQKVCIIVRETDGLKGFSRLPTTLSGSSAFAVQCRRALHILGQQQPPNY